MRNLKNNNNNKINNNRPIDIENKLLVAEGEEGVGNVKKKKKKGRP